MYSIHNPEGLAILTQLRAGLSKLNFHKFRHNFKDAENPLCPAKDGIEDTDHFLLHCHSYDIINTTVLVHYCYPMVLPLSQMMYYSNVCYITESY